MHEHAYVFMRIHNYAGLYMNISTKITKKHQEPPDVTQKSLGGTKEAPGGSQGARKRHPGDTREKPRRHAGGTQGTQGSRGLREREIATSLS